MKTFKPTEENKKLLKKVAGHLHTPDSFLRSIMIESLKRGAIKTGRENAQDLRGRVWSEQLGNYYCTHVEISLDDGTTYDFCACSETEVDT